MQSFAFSPPIKANRGSVRATLPATSGAGFGSGRQLFDPAHVAQASFGYSVAWVISKAPLEGQDDERSTRLHLRFWTFPRSTAEPVVLAVSVPEAHFQPLASCEIPDNRALLIVGASGTVAKINIPHVGRLPSAGDSSSVTVDSVVGRGISAPVVASGSNGVLYISSLGANVVASITLGQDGTFITSRHNLSGANTSRNSGGGGGWSSWVPNVSLSGLLGRRKQQDDASPARGGHAHEGVLRLFCVDGHCFVETAAALTFVSGDGTDDVQWSWNKEFKDGSGRVETILDVAMGTSEIWVLAAGLTAQTAVILTLSRTNADVCTGMMDIAMEDGNTSAPVAATRRAGAASSNNGSTRLHVLDDMNGTIVTRRDVHRCCVAATIRSPQSHVTEPNPSGVVSFASVSLDDSAIAVLTNFGMVRLRGISSQDGSAFADTSMLNVSVRSNASNISRHSQVTPARTTLNRSDALVDSPRDADLSVDVSAVSMHIRAVTQPQRMKYQFTDVEAAEAHGGLDNAWLRASDEIANRLAINPSNWAKGDLTVDDSDGVAFVTNELNRRLAHHTALQQHINGDTKWQRLKLSTQAAIMSRSETLSMYVALRVLHNDACPKNDRLRAELYRSAVVAAANAVRRDDTPHEASSSEIVYGSVDHAALLLAAVNHGLHSAVSDMSIHVKTKIETAAATSELWMAALDGIEAQRGSAAHLLTAELSNMLWTVSRDASESVHSFESVASNFCSIAADALALLVDVASSNPGADVGAISPYANAVVVAIGRVLRFAFSNTLRGQQHIDSLLRRSLFRQPFVANPVGYPRGAPQPVPLPRVDMCNAILSTVEAIAVDFSMMEALFDLGAADRIDWDAAMEVTGPQDIPEWNSARSYAATVRGFYRYFLRRLSQQYREAELYAASKVFERVTDGDVATVWLDFMKKEAPHALWAMHAPAVDSIIASSTLIPFQGLALGDNMMEHRQCSLSLAELEWVAEGRPAVSGKKLENEKRIVTALVTHAPHLSSSAPSTEETVRALLDVNSPASWASAAAIANSVVDSTSRNKLLLAVLSRAFNSEAAHFVGIASDDSLGDRQRTEAFKATATGQIVANSPYLRQLSGDVQVTSAATSAAYAGALYHFVCDAYGDRGAT